MGLFPPCFNQRFIWNYSSMAAPVSALTRSKKAFVWSPETEQQLVIEVDTSDVGVGAVQLQKASSDQRLLLCTFFSRRLVSM